MSERLAVRGGDKIALGREVPFSPNHLRAAGRLALLQVPGLQGDSELRKALGEGNCYSDVARALRPQPLEVQLAFLSKVLELAQFPNHTDLAGFLAKINHPAFPWFAPTQEPKPQSLQLLVDQHLTALNLPPSPLKLIRTDWVAAWGDVAGDVARAAARACCMGCCMDGGTRLNARKRI